MPEAEPDTPLPEPLPLAMDSQPAAATPDGARLPLAFLTGVFLWVAAIASATSMWPNFMARLGYSKTAISSLWGLAALTEAPVMRLAGNLSDVTGRAPLLAAGGIGLAVVMLGYIAVARVLPALIGVQLTRGLAYGAYTASAMTFATELGDQRTRGSNSGLFNAATGAGQLVGLLLGGTLAQLFGFEFLFGVCVVGGLLSGVCFWLLRQRQAVSPASRRLRGTDLPGSSG